MVLSYYFTLPIYNAVWRLLKIFRREKTVVLYCDDAFDAVLFANVGKHLAPVKLVAKNKAVREELRSMGHEASLMPSFPDAVIMFRNMAWKFPCARIVKIGFEHGAYNFKRHSKPHYYNLFDIFFMTSEHDVDRVRHRGVTTACSIGFPKIDSAFDGSITTEQLSSLAASLKLDPAKKTILFSSTWDGSGMSAIHHWCDYVSSLKEEYNLLVTVHSWMGESYKEKLRKNNDIHYIEDYEILRYIILADVCVGDTNSLIAEFCLLDKPIVTFRIPPTERTMPDVIELIEKVSLRVDTFDELGAALRTALSDPLALSNQRREATRVLLGTPDGLAGKRAAERIVDMVPELAPAQQEKSVR